MHFTRHKKIIHSAVPNKHPIWQEFWCYWKEEQGMTIFLYHSQLFRYCTKFKINCLWKEQIQENQETNVSSIQFFWTKSNKNTYIAKYSKYYTVTAF